MCVVLLNSMLVVDAQWFAAGPPGATRHCASQARFEKAAISLSSRRVKLIVVGFPFSHRLILVCNVCVTGAGNGIDQDQTEADSDAKRSKRDPKPSAEEPSEVPVPKSQAKAKAEGVAKVLPRKKPAAAPAATTPGKSETKPPNENENEKGERPEDQETSGTLYKPTPYTKSNRWGIKRGKKEIVSVSCLQNDETQCSSATLFMVSWFQFPGLS